MFSETTNKTSAKEKLATFFFVGFLAIGLPLFSQTLNAAPEYDDLISYAKNAAGRYLAQRFKCFDERHDHSNYSVTLCGDVPDNDRPMKVYVKKEPGHVFLVLCAEDTVCHLEQRAVVFGFYPQRPASSILFKNVRCEIVDNSNRTYDVQIKKSVSASDFELVLENAIAYAQKKYNLNQYNCYNYALDVFNSLPGIEKLPVNKVRFPFIAGKGGSPCCLYRDLKKLHDEGSSWSPYISFGAFTAPGSCKN